MAKFFTVLVLLTLGQAWAFAASPWVRVYEETYPAPTEEVFLSVARGLVAVSTVPAGEPVSFKITHRIQKTDAAKEAVAATEPEVVDSSKHEQTFERMAPRFRAKPEQVRLDIKDPRYAVFDWDPSLQMVIEVRVRIPSGTKVRVHNVAAGVTFDEDYVGNVEIRSEGGSIFAKKIEGDLSAHTRTGSVTVTEVTGRSDLRSDSGMILAGRLHGAAELRSSVGTVEVNQAFETLSVRGANAEIYVGLSEPMPRSVDLRNSAGAITVKIDQNASMQLDASAGFLGSVRLRNLTPVIQRGGPDQSRLVGTLNAGGPVVRIRTGGGALALIGRAPLD